MSKGQWGGARPNSGRKTHTRILLRTGDVVTVPVVDEPGATKSYRVGTVTVISKTGFIIKFDDGTETEIFKSSLK